MHNCLDDLTLEEIANTPIPEGKRAYDGTRAADHTGEGIDGKLRAFITKENSNKFPYLTKLVKKLQSKDSHQKISEFLFLI